MTWTAQIRFLCFLALSLLLTRGADVRFAVYDLIVDTGGEDLAAYQIKIQAPAGTKFAGVEGGEHPAYKEPPAYDAKAINREIIILAALNTGADLPRERTRVASLHVQISGDGDPEFEVRLLSAANRSLKRIQPKIHLRKRHIE